MSKVNPHHFWRVGAPLLASCAIVMAVNSANAQMRNSRQPSIEVHLEVLESLRAEAYPQTRTMVAQAPQQPYVAPRAQPQAPSMPFGKPTPPRTQPVAKSPARQPAPTPVQVAKPKPAPAPVQVAQSAPVKPQPIAQSPVVKKEKAVTKPAPTPPVAVIPAPTEVPKATEESKFSLYSPSDKRDEPAAVPVVAPAPTPELVAKAQPQPEPAPAPLPVPEPIPAPAPEPQPEVKALPKPAPVPAPLPVPEPEPVPQKMADMELPPLTLTEEPKPDFREPVLPDLPKPVTPPTALVKDKPKATPKVAPPLPPELNEEVGSEVETELAQDDMPKLPPLYQPEEKTALKSLPSLYEPEAKADVKSDTKTLPPLFDPDAAPDPSPAIEAIKPMPDLPQPAPESKPASAPAPELRASGSSLPVEPLPIAEAKSSLKEAQETKKDGATEAATEVADIEVKAETGTKAETASMPDVPAPTIVPPMPSAPVPAPLPEAPAPKTAVKKDEGIFAGLKSQMASFLGTEENLSDEPRRRPANQPVVAGDESPALTTFEPAPLPGAEPESELDAAALAEPTPEPLEAAPELADDMPPMPDIIDEDAEDAVLTLPPLKSAETKLDSLPPLPVADKEEEGLLELPPLPVEEVEEVPVATQPNRALPSLTGIMSNEKRKEVLREEAKAEAVEAEASAMKVEAKEEEEVKVAAKEEVKAEVKTDIAPPPPPPPLPKLADMDKAEPKPEAISVDDEKTDAEEEVQLASLPPLEPSVTRKEKGTEAEDAPVLDVPTLQTDASGKPSARLVFGREEYDLTQPMQSVLDELISKMKKSKDMRIKVLSFAGDSLEDSKISRTVALKRGLKIRTYMIEQGIDIDRVNVKLPDAQDDGPSERIDIVSE